MTERTTADRAVAAEYGRLRRAYPALRDDPAALPILRRLATQRVRYQELSRLIAEQGGSSTENLDVVAEARQCSRSCSALEAQLRSWWTEQPASNDAITLMAATRRALVAAAVAREEAAKAEKARLIEHQPTRQPPTAAQLLEQARDGSA
jgi:hypothetical protein